jgi:hypothetical protein
MELFTAHRQWATRPSDERFQTFDQLEAAVAARRHTSYSATWDVNQLRVHQGEAGDLVLGGNHLNAATFSNWSFRQLSTRLGAPSEFVAGLPTRIAADVMNERIRKVSEDGDKVQVLLQDREGQAPLLRAVTSEKYSRAIWDLDVVKMVRKLIDGTSFRNPLAFKDGKFGGEVEPGGLYASDRDVFLTVWDEDNAVEVDNERLFRFALFWNSETGSRTFGCSLGLVRTICRNLILWGARNVTNIKFRHVGAIDERVEAHIPRILESLSLTDPSREREVIRAAIKTQVAKNDEEAVAWLRTKGFALKTAKAAVERANIEENGAGSLWQIIQGVTAHARSISYRDQRTALELKAGELLEAAA